MFWKIQLDKLLQSFVRNSGGLLIKLFIASFNETEEIDGFKIWFFL